MSGVREVMDFIERERLFGLGCGRVDAGQALVPAVGALRRDAPDTCRPLKTCRMAGRIKSVK